MTRTVYTFVASVYSTSTGTQHDRAGKEDRPRGPTEQNVHLDLLPHCPEEKENDSSVGCIFVHVYIITHQYRPVEFIPFSAPYAAACFVS